MNAVLKIQMAKLRPEEDADIPFPCYMTPNSAGMDVYAAVAETVCLNPGQIVKIPTGIAVALPHGYEIQIRPRSGLAANHGITLINSPGTIDADYRGEIMIALINHGQTAYHIRRGDRIAQMVAAQIQQVKIEFTRQLPETNRSDGGFGSTGR